MKRKITAIALLFVIFFNFSSVIVFADAEESVILEFVDDSGVNIKITSFNMTNDNIVFKQYNDGKLFEEVYLNNKTKVMKINNTVGKLQKTYTVQDIIGEKSNSSSDIKNFIDSISRNLSSSYSYLGKINYYGSYSTAADRQLKAESKFFDYDNSSYTIRGYTGSVVALVSAIVGAIAFPEVVVATFVRRLLLGLGINVVGGAIDKALSVTVGADKYIYDIKLTDTKYGYSTTTQASKYIISEKYSNHYKEVYYDDLHPDNWGTRRFAVEAGFKLWGEGFASYSYVN